MMIYFCGMVDWHKALSFFFCWNDCQRFSPLQISNTLQAGFEPVQNPSCGFVEWSCAVVINTTPRRHKVINWDGVFSHILLMDIPCIIGGIWTTDQSNSNSKSYKNILVLRVKLAFPPIRFLEFLTMIPFDLTISHLHLLVCIFFIVVFSYLLIYLFINLI